MIEAVDHHALLTFHMFQQRNVYQYVLIHMRIHLQLIISVLILAHLLYLLIIKQ